MDPAWQAHMEREDRYGMLSLAQLEDSYRSVYSGKVVNGTLPVPWFDLPPQQCLDWLHKQFPQGTGIGWFDRLYPKKAPMIKKEHYGIVQFIKGPRQGTLGYYDDDEGSQAIVYIDGPVGFGKACLVPRSHLVAADAVSAGIYRKKYAVYFKQLETIGVIGPDEHAVTTSGSGVPPK